MSLHNYLILFLSTYILALYSRVYNTRSHLMTMALVPLALDPLCLLRASSMERKPTGSGGAY